MGKICLLCNHERKESETTLKTVCPKCGKRYLDIETPQKVIEQLNKYKQEKVAKDLKAEEERKKHFKIGYTGIGNLKEGFRIIAIFGLISLLVYLQRPSTNKEKKSLSYQIEVQATCRWAVEKQLKSPSSSDFPWGYDGLIKNSPNTYTYNSYVDSKNGFGVNIRTNYTCNVRNSSDKWYLTNLAFHLEKSNVEAKKYISDLKRRIYSGEVNCYALGKKSAKCVVLTDRNRSCPKGTNIIISNYPECSGNDKFIRGMNDGIKYYDSVY
jgi:predicted RNA-binding Zn-ribbon protein involved in translation (DUF1610 family)